MHASNITKVNYIIIFVGTVFSVGACISIAFFDLTPEYKKSFSAFYYVPIVDISIAVAVGILLLCIILFGPYSIIESYKSYGIGLQTAALVFAFNAGVMFAMEADDAYAGNRIAARTGIKVLNPEAYVAASVLSFLSFANHSVGVFFWAIAKR